MEFTSEILRERLVAYESDGRPPARYLVAFSGGMDSSILLHALAQSRGRPPVPLVAVHVDHGLHEQSADWQKHCRKFAATLKVEYHACATVVSPDAGLGLEAAAREARYAALEAMMEPDDWLLSAHHEDDQAETLLLNLMRGSGLPGLAGIGGMRPFGPGFLVRPLLGLPADTLVNYARRHKLQWIEDPSNEDVRFDRNFLRREVMPLLASRWPAVSARLRQSAELSGEASGLLEELADLDIAALGGPERLAVPGLKALSGARQRNVLRHAVRRCGLPPPPATRLYQAVHELLPARADAEPLVTWPGAELRRYRDHLYVLSPGPADVDPGDTLRLSTDRPLELGAGQGLLRLVASDNEGIAPDVVGHGLRVRYRQGGERIRPVGHKCTHKLKKLLQDHGVVPWMRRRVPLLYSGDRLVAVADLWLAADYVEPGAYQVRWEGAPPLF